MKQSTFINTTVMVALAGTLGACQMMPIEQSGPATGGSTMRFVGSQPESRTGGALEAGTTLRFQPPAPVQSREGDRAAMEGGAEPGSTVRFR